MSTPQPADVRLEDVRKSYGDVVAVDGIELEIAAGEFFTMLGPSGSGKTTTLRLIAGFELARRRSRAASGKRRHARSRRTRGT